MLQENHWSSVLCVVCSDSENGQDVPVLSVNDVLLEDKALFHNCLLESLGIDVILKTQLFFKIVVVLLDVPVPQGKCVQNVCKNKMGTDQTK